MAVWDGFKERLQKDDAPKWATPGELAKHLTPETIQTPALDLIDAALVDAFNTPDARLIITMPPQEGKGLPLDTPILTPTGWTTMGALRPGDRIIGGDGQPCTVTAAFPTRLLDCWQVVLRNGSAIVADGDHRWLVRDRNGRGRPWIVVDTRTLAGQPDRYGLPVPPRIELPPQQLPIPPYTFGAWLGDGGSRRADIWVDDPGIIDNIRADGYLAVKRPAPFRWTLRDPADDRPEGSSRPSLLRRHLAALDVWGNKHIPDVYLHGSAEQRLHLVQGLMDTDGSVYRNDSGYSRCEFTTTRPDLARDMLTLTRSLGIDSAIHESRATLNGRDIGPRWRIRFVTDLPVFRLARKADRLHNNPGPRRPKLQVGIRTVTAVPPIPTRCITVDSPHRTFLAGHDLIPTHNTTRVSRDFPAWVLSRNPEIRIQAASYGDDLARENGTQVRSRMHQLGYHLSRDKNAAGNWQLAGHRGGMRSVSLRGGFSGHPADLIIIDDPIKSELEADSKAYREQVWKFWRSEAVARLAPGVMVVIILTRWHEDDLAGRLTKEHGSTWKVLNIPAQANHDPGKGQVDVLGRQPGEFMRSARINKDGRPRTIAQWEQRKREVGTRMWQAQYQGSPVQDQGNIIHRDWWRKYTRPMWVDRDDGSKVTLGVDDQIIISCDLTFKGTDQSDFVVMQVWLRRGVNVYLIDQERGQWSFTQTCERLVQLANRWPQAILKIVEDTANGPAVMAQLANTVPGIVPESPQGSKIARLNAVSPFIEAGNAWVPDPETFGWAWIDDFIDELAAFPSGSHDDQVDACSQALNRLLVQPLINGDQWGSVPEEPEEFEALDQLGWSVAPY